MNTDSDVQKLKILITVKTYPIPSSKYDELVCTAGVKETGDRASLPDQLSRPAFQSAVQEVPVDRSGHGARE